MLWILPNQNANAVANDLRTICPDPGLTINTGTVSLGGMTFSGDGRVRYTPNLSSVGCMVLDELVKSDTVRVGIRGEGPGWPTGDRTSTGQAEVLFDLAGISWPNGAFPNVTQVEIVYDVTSANGRGYYVYDSRQSRLPFPGDVVLLHEMAHAYLGVTGRYSLPGGVSDNIDTVALENQYRRKDPLLGQRAGHMGGSYGTRPDEPRKPGRGSKNAPQGRGRCFVATAAYGSADDIHVRSLRQFRETVLRPTRVGRAFFDEFYAEYERVSPMIVQAMEADDRVRDLMRETIVSPLLEYLLLATDLPEGDLHDVPQPWCDFLHRIRGRLEGWSRRLLELPTSLDGQSPEDAATEVAVILRYLLREPESRARYLETLESTGDLPIRLDHRSYHDIRAALTDGLGLPAEFASRVVTGT